MTSAGCTSSRDQRVALGEAPRTRLLMSGRFPDNLQKPGRAAGPGPEVLPETPKCSKRPGRLAKVQYTGSSAVGSAPALGAGGRGFKSPLPDRPERVQGGGGGRCLARRASYALRARKPNHDLLPTRRRHFGNVRKLPSGRWQASYWHQGLRHLAAGTSRLNPTLWRSWRPK